MWTLLSQNRQANPSFLTVSYFCLHTVGLNILEKKYITSINKSAAVSIKIPITVKHTVPRIDILNLTGLSAPSLEKYFWCK